MGSPEKIKKVKAKLAKRRKFCPHCKNELSLTIFYQHRKLHYDPSTGSWNSKHSPGELIFNYAVPVEILSWAVGQTKIKYRDMGDG